MKHSHRQSGSAFIIILVAIALFAALSYVVAQGSRSSSAALTQEQARLAAQEIIAYGETVAKAVQTLKLRGCSDTQFDFANTAWVNYNTTIIHPTGHNPSAPATGCSVFKAGEGNIPPIVFPSTYFIPAAPSGTQQGSSRIRGMPFPGVGTTNKMELYYNLPLIKDEICLKINSILGVGDVNGALPNIVEGSYVNYAGIYDTGTTPITDTDGKLAGKTAFCARVTVSGFNKYFRALIVR